MCWCLQCVNLFCEVQTKSKPNSYWFGASLYFWCGGIVPPDYVVVNTFIVARLVVTPQKVVWHMASSLASLVVSVVG